MSSEFVTGRSGLGWLATVGALSSAGSLGLLLWGLLGNFDGGNAQLMLIAVGGVGSSWALLRSALIGGPVIWVLARVTGRFTGVPGRLAELNAQRNPRRTAITASALMMGLALVTTFGLVAASLKASTESAVAKSMRSDFVVQSRNAQPLSPSIGDEMNKIDGVKDVYRLRMVPIQLDGQQVVVAAMTPRSFDKILKQSMVSGSLSDFGKNTVLVRDRYADAKHWTVGQMLPSLINGRSVSLRIAGIYSMEENASLADVSPTIHTIEATGVSAADSFLAIDTQPNADKSVVKAALDKIVQPVPLVSVADQQQYADAQGEQLDGVLALINALLGLAIVIAVFGIVNTLGLSIIERTREIGLLRAVGLNKGQVRRMIMLESISISLLGAVLGIGLGLIFGLALQRALAGRGLTDLALPWLQLIVSVVAAVVVGMLASLWPAARATRLDILQAIANR